MIKYVNFLLFTYVEYIFAMVQSAPPTDDLGDIFT